MKKYALEFLKRGLMAASGGPVILALIYAGLGASGAVTSFSPAEVSTGFLTITLMAFVAGGISVIYQIEQMPLLHATLIHAIVLYVDYLLVYLTNEWIPRDAAGIGAFSLIYAAGYMAIWLCVTLCIRARVQRLNGRLGVKK